MDANGPTRLIVAPSGGWQAAWLGLGAFRAGGFETLLLSAGEDQVGTPNEAVLRRTIPFADQDRAENVPDLVGIINAFQEFQPAACLITESGFFSQLLRIVAFRNRIPVFRLVSTSEELGDVKSGTPHALDFRLLTDSSLVERALADDHFGGLLFLTGHPARDLALRDGDTSPSPYAHERFGDGRATERIVGLLDKWRHGILDLSRPDLSVIVPAYKESTNLPLVCGRLLEALDSQSFSSEILLVDDASPDATYATAVSQMYRSPRIRAFSKPTPHGMGNGIRYGLNRARADIVAVTMGDGSDDVAQIPAMFRKVRDEGYGLAIGSRYRFRQNYQAVPPLYRFWSACFRLTTRLLIGLPLSDYTNAFRVFHRRIFERYGPESAGFEISPEITFKAWFATHRVAEVDVKHLKRASGQSTFSFLRAGPGYAKILAKALVNRMTGRWFTVFW